MAVKYWCDRCGKETDSLGDVNMFVSTFGRAQETGVCKECQEEYRLLINEVEKEFWHRRSFVK